MNDNTAPYGAPQQQPYPNGGYAPPPRKSNTLRNVLLVILGLSILGCGGCFAVVGLFAKGVDEAIEASEEQDKLPGGPDNPLTIDPGKGFDVYGFTYQDGWTVRADALGHVEIEGLKFQNDREEKDGAIVEIKFWSGNEVLASADCTSDQVDVGTIGAVNCFSADDMPSEYDKITINDTW